MGLLQVHSDGLKLEEGESEFLSPVYAEEIHSREVSSSPRPPPHPPSSDSFILKQLQTLFDCRSTPTSHHQLLL